jgi:hypothetical protein
MRIITLAFWASLDKYEYVLEQRSPLWSSGQSSWLQIQTSGFDSRPYQIFWEVVGLERGPFSFVRIIEELLERKVAARVQKTEINGREESLRWPRDTPYPLKLALTSAKSGGRSLGIVRACGLKPRSWFLFVCIRAKNVRNQSCRTNLNIRLVFSLNHVVSK